MGHCTKTVLQLGAIMSKILPVIFVLILGVVGVGMDFHLFNRNHEGPSIGFAGYVKARASGAVAAAELASGTEFDAADPLADAATASAEASATPAKETPVVVSLAKGGTPPSAASGGCVRRAGKLDCPKE